MPFFKLLLGLLYLKKNFANNNNVPKNFFHNFSQSSPMYYVLLLPSTSQRHKCNFYSNKKVEEETRANNDDKFCMSNNSSSLLNLRLGTRKLSHFCVFVIFSHFLSPPCDMYNIFSDSHVCTRVYLYGK